MTTMKPQRTVHPHATAIIAEHRKAVRDRRNVAKDESISNENRKTTLIFLDRVISYTGQVYNHRISKKSAKSIAGLS